MTTPTPTVDLSGIITQGKTRELLNFTATAAGSKSVRFTSEAEALKFSLNVVSATGQIYWEVYEEPGDSNGHEVLVLQTSTHLHDKVMQRTLSSVGKLRIDFYYFGAISLELSATGIAASPALPPALPPAPTSSLASDIAILSCLESIDDSLRRILNHQRQITDLESDKGDDY